MLARLGLEVESPASDASVTATLRDGVLAETVTDALVAAGVRVRGLVVAGDTLEDRFVALTGEGFDVAG